MDKGGGVVVVAVGDELRCIRSDGKRWRCKQQKADGKAYCLHHLLWSVRYKKKKVSYEHSDAEVWGWYSTEEEEEEEKEEKEELEDEDEEEMESESMKWESAYKEEEEEEESDSENWDGAAAEEEEIEVALDRAEGSTRYRRKGVLTGQDKAKSCAIARALELKGNLDHGFPSFVKSMCATQVSGQFRLRTPPSFCNHLPKQNVMISLIDENHKEYRIRYLANRSELRCGWRDFSIEHKLKVGDALVFQLVESSKFQVYVLKAYSMAETDEAAGLQDTDAQKKIKSRNYTKTSGKTLKRCRKIRLLTAIQEPVGRKVRCGSEEVVSDALECIKFVATTVDFKDMKHLESFTVVVNGLIINSEFSEQARSKYYELCCSQKAFLHDNLCKTINCKCAAGLISQIINIADHIRGSKLSTPLDDFSEWDKTLGAFGQVGMNVGFLRDRIKKLVTLVHESEDGVDSIRCGEAIAGRDNVKNEIRTLKAKHVQLKEDFKKFDNEIKIMEMKVVQCNLKLQVELNAPW